MRISDWSSDWCLPLFGDPFVGAAAVALLVHAEPCGLVAVPAGVAELLVLRADVALHVEVVAGFPVAVLAAVPQLVELGVAPVGAVALGGVVSIILRLVGVVVATVASEVAEGDLALGHRAPHRRHSIVGDLFRRCVDVACTEARRRRKESVCTGQMVWWAQP